MASVCAVEEDGKVCGQNAATRGMCHKHYKRWRLYGDPLVVKRVTLKGTAPERFFARVNRSGPPPARNPELGPCWLWTGSLNDWGYGRFDGNGAHRWSYVNTKGPIPAGHDVDHLCVVPQCVNPDHLEAVTVLENVMRSTGLAAANARKTHCPRGHPYDAANTRYNSGRRVCRECERASYHRRKRRGAA